MTHVSTTPFKPFRGFLDTEQKVIMWKASNHLFLV